MGVLYQNLRRSGQVAECAPGRKTPLLPYLTFPSGLALILRPSRVYISLLRIVFPTVRVSDLPCTAERLPLSGQALSPNGVAILPQQGSTSLPYHKSISPCPRFSPPRLFEIWSPPTIKRSGSVGIDAHANKIVLLLEKQMKSLRRSGIFRVPRKAAFVSVGGFVVAPVGASTGSTYHPRFSCGDGM